MELCSGGSLTSFCNQTNDNNLLESKAANCFKGIFSALAYLHERNIAHRDIKPDNFIWTLPESHINRDIKLLDFGLAKVNEKDEYGSNLINSR